MEFNYPFVTGTVVTPDTDTIVNSICKCRWCGVPVSLEHIAELTGKEFLSYFWEVNMPGSLERERLLTSTIGRYAPLDALQVSPNIIPPTPEAVSDRYDNNSSLLWRNHHHRDEREERPSTGVPGPKLRGDGNQHNQHNDIPVDKTLLVDFRGAGSEGRGGAGGRTQTGSVFNALTLACACNPFEGFVCMWCRSNTNANVLQLDFFQVPRVSALKLPGFFVLPWRGSQQKPSIFSPKKAVDSHTACWACVDSGDRTSPTPSMTPDQIDRISISNRCFASAYNDFMSDDLALVNALDVCIEINLRIARHPYALRYLKRASFPPSSAMDSGTRNSSQ